MLRIYFKQAWELLKQNPLFSSLYIVGTGLAIGMTMLVSVIYYVKLAPVYPEYNRPHLLYMDRLATKNESGSMWINAFSYQALQEWALKVKHAEAVSATMGSRWLNVAYIQPDDRSGDFRPMMRLTDPAFFRIYPFQFLEGKPFTEADLASGTRTAVITDDLARRLFGRTEGVTGQTFSLDYQRFRVCGVVRSGSYLTRQSYAQVYLPYTVAPRWDRDIDGGSQQLGSFSLTYLTRDQAQADSLHAEIADIVRRINLAPSDGWTLNIYDQPRSHAAVTLQPNPQQTFSLWQSIRQFLLIGVVLLLVPALNLSGMISSRMDSRLAEMGVRKSFGASRSRLLGQVMWENLLLTLLGGLLGLVLAWTCLYVGREWFFDLLEDWAQQIPQGVEAYVSGEMLFAPAVFICALLLCVVLNLLSALVPAWFSLRKPIVKSLYERR